MKRAKKLGISKEEIDEALCVAFILYRMPAYVAGKTAAEKYTPEKHISNILSSPSIHNHQIQYNQIQYRILYDIYFFNV